MSEAIKTRFGKRALKLPKTRGWKQNELGKEFRASGVSIGRCKRGEMTPSIGVAQRMAEVFGVIVNCLVGEQELPNLLSQSDMVEGWATIASLPSEDRDRVPCIVQSLTREAKTRHAFTTP